MLALLGGTLLGGVQLRQPYDAVADGAYKLPDGSVTSLIGVCRYDESEISCWDGKGTVDASLTQKVIAYYIQSNDQGIPVALHKKNRIIVFSKPGRQLTLQMSTLQENNYGMTALTPNDGDLTWAAVKSPRSATKTDVLLSIYGIPGPTPVVAPFVEGRKIHYDGKVIEMGGSRPSPLRNVSPYAWGMGSWNGNSPEKWWTYYLGVDPPTQSLSSLYATPLNRKGRPILFVDSKGNPVEKPKGATFVPPPIPPSGGAATFASPATMTPGIWNGSTVFLNTNVNPAAVGFLQISSSRQLRVLFRDVPLEPR